jgi:hypothetical protein
MNTAIKTDDVIFNFFKQICDEKDDQKCVELGKEWIKAMETNLSSMEANLIGATWTGGETCGPGSIGTCNK